MAEVSRADPTATVGRPTCAVVLCTRGRAEFLPECVRSIAEAMSDGDELFVVESGERHDDLAAVIGVPLTYLWTGEPGKSRQLNLGIRNARADVILVTDDDCRVAPGWIDAMAVPFLEDGVGLAFGPVENLDHVPGPPAPVLPAGPAPIQHWDYAHGPSMAIRRSAAIDVGGFDERLGPGASVHGEEADLLLRLAEKGWSCRIAAAPAVRHLDWRSAEETQRNLLVYEKGGGALMGAALRRNPRKTAKVFVLRLLYQARLWEQPRLRGWTFGPRTSLAFLRGLITGLRFPPRRWL